MKINLIALLIILMMTLVNCSNGPPKGYFNRMVGVYQLDLSKTDLGGYASDSSKYKLLKLSLYRDTTFRFNKSVPFITDTSGVWEVGGTHLEDWNEMYFENGIRVQFDECFGEDSTMLLNSVTPRVGEEPVFRITFRKLHHVPFNFCPSVQ